MPEQAIAHAQAMVEAGAAVVDVGGESTRPGADGVAAEEEIRRVVPVIEVLARRLPVPISIDTSKPAVMRAAAAAGAGLINDVRALRAPGALSAAAELALPVCLMHMRGEPRTMQVEPRYDDVVAEVAGFLRERLAACEDAGISPRRLLIDPGFGFGKTMAHNLRLLSELRALTALQRPLVVGLSRKSMLGRLTGRDVGERIAAGVGAAVLAVERGAALVRTHDVAETVDALKIVAAVARA